MVRKEAEQPYDIQLLTTSRPCALNGGAREQCQSVSITRPCVIKRRFFRYGEAQRGPGAPRPTALLRRFCHGYHARSRRYQQRKMGDVTLNGSEAATGEGKKGGEHWRHWEGRRKGRKAGRRPRRAEVKARHDDSLSSHEDQGPGERGGRSVRRWRGNGERGARGATKGGRSSEAHGRWLAAAGDAERTSCAQG